MKGVNALLFENMNLSDRNVIDKYINQKDIIDYGIISKVNSDGTVDVRHAVKRVMATGEVIEPFTETPRIEVLWPSSKEFSLKFKLSVGDRVLLVGLKASFPTVNVTEPRPPSSNYHYSQETLKAIPACLYAASSEMIIEIESGKMKLANKVNSLGAVLDELMDALTTGWTSINCVVGAPVTPLPTTITAINAVRTKLATLFEE